MNLLIILYQLVKKYQVLKLSFYDMKKIKSAKISGSAKHIFNIPFKS